MSFMSAPAKRRPVGRSHRVTKGRGKAENSKAEKLFGLQPKYKEPT